MSIYDDWHVTAVLAKFWQVQEVACFAVPRLVDADCVTARRCQVVCFECSWVVVLAFEFWFAVFAFGVAFECFVEVLAGIHEREAIDVSHVFVFLFGFFFGDPVVVEADW